MLSIIKFIFSNFWIWLGFFILMITFFEGITGIISMIAKSIIVSKCFSNITDDNIDEDGVQKLKEAIDKLD